MAIGPQLPRPSSTLPSLLSRLDRRQLKSESSRKRFEANDGGPLFPACDGPPHGARARPARSSHAHGPKLPIYSHIVRLSSDQIPPGPVERFIAVTREKYDGRLEIGEDLTTFEITATVRVKRGSPFAANVRPVLRPKTAVHDRFQGTRKQGGASLAIRRGCNSE